jgi:hypothetical protein
MHGGSPAPSARARCRDSLGRNKADDCPVVACDSVQPRLVGSTGHATARRRDDEKRDRMKRDVAERETLC